MSSDTSTPRRRVPLALEVRLGRIFWRLLPWIGFAALLLGASWILGAAPPALRQIAVLCGIVLAYGLVLALVTEILAPDRSDLRVVPMRDSQARRLAAALKFLLFFTLVAEVGRGFILANGWHTGVADLLLIVRNVVLVLSGAMLLSALGFYRWLASGKPDTWRGILGRFATRVLAPIAVLTLLFVVIANGLGYTPLASHVAENMAETAVKLALALLVYRWLRGRLYETVHFYRADDPPAEAGAEEPATVEADPVALGAEKIGGGILLLLTCVGTFFWILGGWGFPLATVLSALGNTIVPGGELTWRHLLGGIASVIGVLFVGWLIRNVLTFLVFPGSKVGVGARYAILAMLRYAVIALAIIFGMGALGVDTSSLGWFFGAAGIGIGLGLQDIIGNFVSGLIMLIERPIRVGDNVQVGTAMGTVENIHMRGTVLRTFDNTTVLIPNKQLLGERVTNLTHGMSHARVIVEVGVAYGADPAAVRRVLLDVATANSDVVTDPEPAVQLSDFADSALLFRLITHTQKVTGRFGVASALRTAIYDGLNEAGIEIPFPQSDLHLRSGWPQAPEAPRP